ncbi:hypothetical protein AKJ65_08105 [candidate division MSBL1 archaeon SCGC-AAA259E19]|uniref:Uncharacterized protein n=1 Tax=candidate division MSBL1 archaeon SCGC-AAA259E19 TaxID=1698264 RepID=A0A133UCY6_9EURY|nr:hypothetical protein AKJ65_08105 [candidate division MSBL1 archaeon SCGC-AAA259E19]
MEEKSGYSEQTTATAKLKDILRKLLAAEDVVGMRDLKGELSAEEASKLGGSIAAAVEGVVLTALRDRDLAEEIAPVLFEKIEEGVTDPLPYKHFLQMLGYVHRLEIRGETQDPKEMFRAYAAVRKKMDLGDVEKRRAELKKELDEMLTKRSKGKHGKNSMFA